MSSIWNGRAYAATVWRKVPLEIIWDGQVWNMDAWAMPKGGPNPEQAKAFITFATDAKRMAEQASYLAYGPTRRSAARPPWDRPCGRAPGRAAGSRSQSRTGPCLA